LTWGEFDLADDVRPADTGIEPKAVEGAPGEVILAITGISRKSLAARGARELTDRDGSAVEDRERWVVWQALPQPLP
jgi:hypothetical protein